MRRNLKVAIARSGKSQRELARAAGIRENRLSSIVNGWMEPNAKDRAAIAAALGRPERGLFAKSTARGAVSAHTALPVLHDHVA